MMVAGLSKEEQQEKSRALLERYNKNALWWNDHLPELTARYPGQCVAVYGQRVVCISSDYQELVAEVKARGYPLRETVREYVHPERITPLNILRMEKPSEEDKARLERYHKDVVWFGAHRDELREKYPDQWVGVYCEQVIGASSDLGKLLRETCANGYFPGEIAYDFISTDNTPRYWVYTPLS